MKYDKIIPLGSSCCPGLSLISLNLRKEAYPFDWVRSNSKIIYDVLVNGKDKYLTFNNEHVSNDFYVNDLHSFTQPGFNGSHINQYGQHFTHYTDLNTEQLKTKFDKYLDRFFDLLNCNKRVLFIHSNEEHIYHKKTRDDRVILYDYLCKINDIIKEKFPNLTFKILNIDINNTFENYGDIINLNMNYGLSFSDKCEHHSPKFYNPYRNNVTYIIKNFIDNGVGSD